MVGVDAARVEAQMTGFIERELVSGDNLKHEPVRLKITRPSLSADADARIAIVLRMTGPQPAGLFVVMFSPCIGDQPFVQAAVAHRLMNP